MIRLRETIKQEEYAFTALFEPAEEGGYVVTCPALEGLITQGETLDEAREMVRDAIGCYIGSLRKDGLPVPRDKEIKLEPVKEKVHIKIPVS